MAESKGIKEIVNQLAILAVTAVAFRHADVGLPTNHHTKPERAAETKA